MALINYATAIQTLAPGAEWSMTNADDYSTLSWFSVGTPQPTQAECDAEITKQTQEAPLALCKQQASNLLSATDWTSIADVANPTVSNPYLMNQSEFLSYRSQVRALAVNPVVNPTFPPVPTAQWSS